MCISSIIFVFKRLIIYVYFALIIIVTKMKKNLLGAIVIFFVTFACLLAISEANNKETPEVDAQYITHN